MLTDKAKEKFEEWYYGKYLSEKIVKYENVGEFFESLHLIFQQALIVEWLDSIGFHIGRDMVDNYWLENSTFYERLGLDGYDYIPTIKTLSEAIEKANNLINLK